MALPFLLPGRCEYPAKAGTYRSGGEDGRYGLDIRPRGGRQRIGLAYPYRLVASTIS